MRGCNLMRRAFTLIELLVVVTIITVLLALLLPAMGKAIYQATLATCGARLKGTANAVTIYAQGAKGYYPDRGIQNQKSDGTKFLAAMQLNVPQFNYDMRPPLKGLMDINKSLQCPFSDVGIDLVQTPQDVAAAASYAMFWAWSYMGSAAPDETGMFKLGDTFTWDKKSFGLLAMDLDLVYPDGTQSSHPDYSPQRMTLVEAHDDVLFGTRSRLSRWRLGPSLDDVINRSIQQEAGNDFKSSGFRDLNYAYGDGSVQRTIRVENFAKGDPRMTYIPLNFDARRFNWRWSDSLQVPNVQTK